MAEAVISYLSTHGYLGVFLLMIAENLFPPIPSEVILPFIGNSVAIGDMNFTIALFVSTAGAMVGTFFWYLLGWYVPAEKLSAFFRRYGGYVAISEKDFKKATAFFVKFEIPAVFFGRMMPGVRSLISIPAGSVRMKIGCFLIYSFIGTMVWNTVLISIGYFAFNEASFASQYMNQIGNFIIYSFIFLYVAQVVRFIFFEKK